MAATRSALALAWCLMLAGAIVQTVPTPCFGQPGAVELAPSPIGQLELLASDSIYANGFSFSMSGAPADANSLPNPFKPAFRSGEFIYPPVDNTNPVLDPGFGLFAFVADTPTTQLHAGDPEPMRFYAAAGDIVGLTVGDIRVNDEFSGITPRTWYRAAKPMRMIAGRDIVGFVDDDSLGSLVVHNDPTDVSVVSAGRDIFYAKLNIAGPGLLEVSAGRNLYQADKGNLHSAGPIVDVDSENRNSGAGITVMAGIGADGPDYAGFAARYLDSANLADPQRPLADQPGKVAKVYDEELVDWLQARFGYTGESSDALAYFDALPVEQRGIFLREVYYAELRAGGREYNDADSRRYGSYLRGRDAIAAFFPEQDAEGNDIAYDGDITMFSSQAKPCLDCPLIQRDAGVRTDFGGDIQLLTPGGQTIIGVEGIVPGASAGLVTQGSGDISLYSKASILLGLSRIMTTFGGDILAWSAQGDINAGRGAKTTVVYTPPRRLYDDLGNTSLSPVAPSNGAGIATLDPIPEVPAGDVDLIAPLGTIDAGEAGIRVSGNVNLAALHIVNAANIQVKGEATGIPVAAAVNTGALTSASAAASSATQAAQDMVRRQQNDARRNLPSIISVQVLGFGEASSGVERPPERPASMARYNPDSPVQVLGMGALTEEQRKRLTEAERSRLAP